MIGCAFFVPKSWCQRFPCAAEFQMAAGAGVFSEDEPYAAGDNSCNLLDTGLHNWFVANNHFMRLPAARRSMPDVLPPTPQAGLESHFGSTSVFEVRQSIKKYQTNGVYHTISCPSTAVCLHFQFFVIRLGRQRTCKH